MKVLNNPFWRHIRPSGFTLIELMVVVAIIGILMAAGIVAFANASLNSRDAKRIADMDAIAKTLEQYYTDNGQYPATQINSTTVGWVSGALYTTLSPYLSGLLIPIDPKNVAPYMYILRSADRATMGNGTSKFCVFARLENATKGNCTAPGAGVYDCPFTTSGATSYCFQNVQ